MLCECAGGVDKGGHEGYTPPTNRSVYAGTGARERESLVVLALSELTVRLREITASLSSSSSSKPGGTARFRGCLTW